MDEPARPSVYRIGDFRVDAQQRLLLHHASGRRLPLSSKAFDLLLFFIGHPGELLDKSTLMAAVWPKVVVEENNLNQHISALRRALGERPEEHRFIVTVPGRGYRFVAAVMPAPKEPTTASSVSVQNAPVQASPGPGADFPAHCSSLSRPWPCCLVSGSPCGTGARYRLVQHRARR